MVPSGARLGRVGGLAAVAVAATPFAYLWVLMLRSVEEPLTVRRALAGCVQAKPG